MINNDYSHKDFTGVSLRTRSVSGFDGSEIVGTCFSQQKPNTKVFPDGITGVIFRGCNLDNVFIPRGNTIENSPNRNIVMQMDNMNWIVDKTGKPIEPAAKKLMLKKGMSINPKDLPVIQRIDSIFDNRIKVLAKTHLQAYLENINV